MPFLLVGIGLIVLLAGYQNTGSQLAAQIQKDFSGSGSFTVWIVAIGIFGAIGYIPALKTLSRLFIALILIVLALRNGGIFQQLAAISTNVQAPAASTEASTGAVTPDVPPSTTASASATGTVGAAAQGVAGTVASSVAADATGNFVTSLAGF